MKQKILGTYVKPKTNDKRRAKKRELNRRNRQNPYQQNKRIMKSMIRQRQKTKELLQLLAEEDEAVLFENLLQPTDDSWLDKDIEET